MPTPDVVSPGVPPGAPSPAPPGNVVLVVDDALDTLRMLCAALATEHYTVLVARDGEEALQRFEHAVPDAVLLDAVMPGLDGFEVCRRLKAEPAWAQVPVIFMTGLAETEQIVAGFAAGGVDYVVKPLKVPEVLARLATHLRNARASQGAARADTPGPRRLAEAQLTPREIEVLGWLAKGKTNRDIGDILGLSHRTVNKHLEHIFEKLGVETRAAAAALASQVLG